MSIPPAGGPQANMNTRKKISNTKGGMGVGAIVLVGALAAWQFILSPSIAAEEPPPSAPQEPPSTSRGEVLLYSDNSPGAIVLAGVMLRILQSSDHSVTVKTAESDFLAALSTRQWKNVSVFTRFSSTAPRYASALRAYVAGGGWAQIYTWRDDPNEPAAMGSVVLAPTAIHIWTRGSTVTRYALCGDSRDTELTPGYTLSAFEASEAFLPAFVLPGSEYVPCTAGVYVGPSSPRPPQTTQQAVSDLVQQLLDAYNQLLEDIALCHEVYGGDEQASPPIPPDVEALEACLKAASREYSERVAAAVRRYRLMKKRLTPPTPTTQQTSP